MSSALLLVLVLAQVCSEDTLCSTGGFLSRAGLFYGSGSADFTCGNSDNLADGGWGGQSKYCLLRALESESYSGQHADFTLHVGRRSAGYLLGVENQYWASGFHVFDVAFDGTVWSWGSYYASQNGGGIRNAGSYLALVGRSSNPGVHPDVQARAWAPHADGGYVFGVESGASNYVFRVRDDGALELGSQVLRVTAGADALQLTQELSDGGQRVASLPWQN